MMSIGVRERASIQWCYLTLGGVAWLLGPGSAAADDRFIQDRNADGVEAAAGQPEPSDNEVDEASAEEAAALVARAGEARAARRLAEARGLLERSLSLNPLAATAFNLALVLDEIGRHLRAVALLESLKAGDFGALPSERQEAVNGLIARARTSVASLRLVGHGEGEARVRLDGLAVGTLVSGQPIEREVDPGSHLVSLRMAQRDSIEQTVDLSPGERRELEFGLDSGAESPPADPVDADPDDSVFTSPVFWTVVGLVVVAAVAVPVTLILTDQEPEQVVDPVLGNREVLRAAW